MRIFKIGVFFIACSLGLSISNIGFCGQEKATNKKDWDIYKSTFAFCLFSLDYPSELGKPGEPGSFWEKSKSRGLVHRDVWEPEIIDKYNHPIKLYFDVAIYKKPNKAEEDPGILDSQSCLDAFPFNEEDSTSTTKEGFKVEDYRYCEGVMADYAVEGGPFEFEAGQVPHEILVRIIELPTCTIKFTLEMPIVFNKDYSKLDYHLSAKDTPQLKKKKQDIRKKIMRTLNSFKYLDQTPRKNSDK